MTNAQSELCCCEAIARNCGSRCLSLPSAGNAAASQVARFLAEHEGGFLLESVPAGSAIGYRSGWIAASQLCGVAFKSMACIKRSSRRESASFSRNGR